MGAGLGIGKAFAVALAAAGQLFPGQAGEPLLGPVGGEFPPMVAAARLVVGAGFGLVPLPGLGPIQLEHGSGTAGGIDELGGGRIPKGPAHE